MNIFITLDYEMFFGTKFGNLKTSIIDPTDKLLSVASKHNITITFFVDIGYIIKLEEYKKSHKILEEDYELIVEQIKSLISHGHDVQLHVHPHWEDSYYDGSKWVIVTTRYRLHDFSYDEIQDIVHRYKRSLEKITAKKIFTYRAGGWCIQPFSKIKNALKNNGIWLDSTLYYDGMDRSSTHFFNFKKMPKKSQYRFEDDPLIEVSNGFFMEIPISSYRVSPLFFLKKVFLKKFGATEYKIYGDGRGLSSGSLWNKFKTLMSYTSVPVSIDEHKSLLLQKAFDAFCNAHREEEDSFVILGHVKLLSQISLENLELFIQNNNLNNFTTYSKEFDTRRLEENV